MFLGDLSSRTERQARKVSNTQKAKNEENLKSDDKIAYSPLPKKGPILYNTENPEIPRDVIFQFYTKCSELMKDESTVASIVRNHQTKGIGLEKANIEFQTDVMENIFQIEKVYGCKYMSVIQTLLPDDIELLELGKQFTYDSIHCYTNAIKYRAKLTGGKLRKSGGMSRTTILEFFEGCNSMMAMKETKAILRTIYQSTNEPPNQKIIDIQHEVLELLGLDHTYGVSCLNTIPKDYPDDKEIAVRMNQFVLCAQLACREATWTDVQNQEFYKNVPMYLHYFPHIYVYQQQIIQQQKALSEQSSRMESMKIVQNYFTSPEGATKLKSLNSKIEASKTRASQDVQDWDVEKRQAFFESFIDHPVLSLLSPTTDTSNSTATDSNSNSSSTDSFTDFMDKINKFMNLSESDMDDMMKMQLILSEDIQKGGTLTRQLSSSGAGKMTIGNLHTLRSFAQLGGNTSFTSSGGSAHMGGGGGGHVHDAQCQHGTCQPKNTTPDVATGRGDKMDR